MRCALKRIFRAPGVQYLGAHDEHDRADGELIAKHLRCDDCAPAGGMIANGGTALLKSGKLLGFESAAALHYCEHQPTALFAIAQVERRIYQILS